MAKDSRELIKYNKMFLDDIGINYSYNYEIIDFAADKGYVKLDKDSAAKLDMAIQYIPDLLLNSELYKGTYRVVFDKELGNLQKAANNPGLFRANIVKEGTNNVITGQALLQEVSAVPQIVGNVFAVASVVTGQYYMEQINKKLEKIEKTAQDILAFLENDKRSKIESQIEFLLNVQKNYQYILDNDSLRESTLVNIQNIKIDSLANINFYKRKIEELENVDIKKDDIEEIIKNVNILVNSFSGYWYALYLYCMTSCMEIYLGRIYDNNYIENVKKDMEQKCKQYSEDLKIWKSNTEKYIIEANAFDENKIIKHVKELKNVPGLDVTTLSLKTIGLLADYANIVDKEKKAEKKKKVFSEVEKIMPFSNIKQIESKQDDLTLFNTMANGKLEVIKDNEEIYIKIPKNKENR